MVVDLSNRFFQAESLTGRCYVMTFSKSHNTTLANMSKSEVSNVIDAWTGIYSSHVSENSPLATLISNDGASFQAEARVKNQISRQFRYMQIFENKGLAMGCSNPHPHGQIWVVSELPEEPAAELKEMRKYSDKYNGAHLLVDYASLESHNGERTIVENESFIAVCPWWAVWPFEVLILCKVHRRSLIDLCQLEKSLLAETIVGVTRKYDNLYETSFPYSKKIIRAFTTNANQID